MLAALSQLLVFNSVNLTREMASILLVLPLVWLLQALTPKEGHRTRLKMIGIGVRLGLLILVDPVFMFVGAAGSAIYTLCAEVGPRRRVLAVVALWLAVFATVAPLKHLVVSPTSVVERLSLLTRPRVYAIHVSRDYSSYARELFDRGINVFAYPTQSIPNAMKDPITTADLVIRKVWLDFRRFFFEGNSGAFFPLLLVANSFFSAHALFYGCFFAAIGLTVSVKSLIRREHAWDHAVLLSTLVAYSCPYIVLFFGMTRFRATVHPLLLLWIGVGLAAAISWSAGDSSFGAPPSAAAQDAPVNRPGFLRELVN